MATKEPGIIPYGPNGRYEVQAEGRRIAVFDDLIDAHLFIAGPQLLAACEAARKALGTLDYKVLGYNQKDGYPYMDELLYSLDAAIAAARQEEPE